MKLAAPLDRDGRGRLAILEGGDGGLEIAAVGHAVGADRAAAGQFELLPVVLADKAARGAVDKFYPVDQPARQDGDLLRLQVDDAQFSAEPQPTLLRDDEQFAVGGVEIFVHHRRGDEVDVAGHAHLRVHVPRRGHGPHPRQPGQLFVRVRHRVPAVLTERDHVIDHMGGASPIGQRDLFIA